MSIQFNLWIAGILQKVTMFMFDGAYFLQICILIINAKTESAQNDIKYIRQNSYAKWMMF